MSRGKTKIGIVVVAYNRLKSMIRLLDSLNVANYGDDTVDLIISLDKAANHEEMEHSANEFVWPHGNKRVRTFNERQGLKRHIIQCGDLVESYDAIVVLEDDLTVSPYYYEYLSQVLPYYQDDERIAGISLYRHFTNVNVSRFFEPEFTGSDVFAMQFAQSWGQCWTKKMWNRFKAWFVDNDNSFFENPQNPYLKDIPDNIIRWGKQSWLKYYMAYMVVNNLFFIYPYHSLSTDHSEVGQHCKEDTEDFQVPMVAGSFTYRLNRLEDLVKYDIFFERIDLKIPEYEGRDLIFDLYGSKKSFQKDAIVISSNRLPYKIIDTWKLKYHPHERNCVIHEKGNGLFVYDTNISAAIPTDNSIIRTRYDVRATNTRHLLKLACHQVVSALRGRISRLIKGHNK